MALTPEQRFFGTVLPLLLRNSESFSIMWNGKMYYNIDQHLYCDGVIMPEYRLTK